MQPDAARVQIRPGRDVVEHAHHVVHSPANHRFTEQQRTAGGGLAALLREPVTRVDRISAAPERHRFNRHRRQTGLRHLDGEVVRVARLVGSIASLFVDADDVVHAAPMTGHADHGGRGRGRAGRNQDVHEHADAGTAVEHHLLAPVALVGARLERDGTQRLPRRGESTDELGQFGSKSPLPRFRLRPRPGLEAQPARRRLVAFVRVRHRIESAIVKACRDPGERTHVV